MHYLNRIGVVQKIDGAPVGSWVHGSRRYWQSQLKTKDDYHGNFTADLFEKWFRELCASLAATVGNCIVHMDGAKYHKRLVNTAPSAKWRKADIQNWLTYRNIHCLAGPAPVL